MPTSAAMLLRMCGKCAHCRDTAAHSITVIPLGPRCILGIHHMLLIAGSYIKSHRPMGNEPPSPPAAIFCLALHKRFTLASTKRTLWILVFFGFFLHTSTIYYHTCLVRLLLLASIRLDNVLNDRTNVADVGASLLSRRHSRAGNVLLG